MFYKSFYMRLPSFSRVHVCIHSVPVLPLTYPFTITKHNHTHSPSRTHQPAYPSSPKKPPSLNHQASKRELPQPELLNPTCLSDCQSRMCQTRLFMLDNPSSMALANGKAEHDLKTLHHLYVLHREEVLRLGSRLVFNRHS